MLACNFEVDVNFHDQDDGHNLVENCRIHTPVWHSWPAIGVGIPEKHHPPGPGNILFNNSVVSKGKPGYSHQTLLGAVPGRTVVYQVATKFGIPAVAALLTTAPPLSGTFYAVKRTHQ